MPRRSEATVRLFRLDSASESNHFQQHTKEPRPQELHSSAIAITRGSVTPTNNRLAEARALYQRFPGNDLSRFNLAQALCDAGEFADALEHLQALAGKKRDWMVAHILLGKTLLALGRSGEAKPVLQHALELAVAQHHDGPREELTELLNSR
jgi:predicted Zn-dependent protease